MVDYRVRSVETKFRIAQTGLEQPGAPVITDTGHPHAPPLHHHLTFSAPVPHTGVAVVTIKQYNGLYIGLNEEIGRLVWTPTPYEWLVASAKPYYQFFPKDGIDLYWYQSKQIVPFVGAAPGKDLVPPEPFFEVEAV